MAVTFNIQFRISVATKVIRLTDTSTGFTYGKGCFKVEFPNGVVRNLPDFSTPDISTSGNFIDIPCEVDASGNVVTGSYTISYAVIDNLSAGQTPLVRTFDFNWVEPTNGITNFSDVIIPEVVFKDLTSYSPIGSFTGALTRTISSSFPSTSEVSAQAPITSTSTNTITVVSGANYYEGVYTPTSNVSVAYTHSSNAWLTILYTRTFSKTFAIKKCPNQLELVQKINAYRVIIDAYKETNDTQFNILSEQYDLVIALYSHLIAMHQTSTQDGSEPILRELLSILEPYSGTYTYQSTKMLTFSLAVSGANSFSISDGTNTDVVPLGSTLTFVSGNAALVPIVTNNNITYSPTFGTAINTFAQGNDARFHNPVTIGTANGLSISTQALSLAAATSGSAGAMSAADKTKLDGIATGATANTGTVTSVGLTAPAAFTVTGSPITTTGTLAIAAAGTSAQYITGAGALATLNTLNVPENTNLYFTNSRARTSISLTTTGTTGAATYDNTTGVLNIPSYIGGVTSFNTRTGAIVLSSADVTTALTYTPVPNNRNLTINGVTFDLTADRSWTIASGVTSFNTRTGAITPTAGDYTTALVTEVTNLYYTDARARAAISLTTTGTSGSATYDNATGVLNIPAYQGGVTSFNTRTGAITLTSSDVTTALTYTPYNATNPAGYITGITSGNVTTALGYTPENAANKGIANGYASLDGGGLVPSTQLPSYVDDVLEFANLAALPATGETGKIYVALDTNKIYRWSGATYIEVSPTVGTIWGGITGTLSNQTDLQSVLDGKQANLSGTGFVKSTAGTISYDTATYYPYPTGNATQYVAGDGSLIAFPVAGQAGTLVRLVRNQTGATLTKGTVVYISGATGNNPIVTKALATGDATSAQTFGLCQANIANNAEGYVVITGDLTGIDTSAFTEGQQLYLSSTTAGAYTATKQYAPNHLVYIGIITRAHPTLGQIEVNIQNGYEMDELHNVSAQSPSNNDGLFYNTTTSLWEKKSIATALGFTPYNATNPNNYIALTALSFVAGSGAYNSTTGAITIPTNTTHLTNGSNYIALTALSSSATGLTYTNTTGVFSLTAGYEIPTTASIATWDTAYTNRITSLTTTGSSGASTLVSNVLNIPTYTLTGLGGVPTTRNITINGTTYDLSADRSWTITTNPNSRNVQDYTATAAQTTFTVTNGYIVGLIDVFVNGSKLTASEFTATNGTTFVLTVASTVGDQVQSINYTASVNGISGAGTANYVPKFTASGTIGNSSIQDLTTGVLVSPTVTAASAIARGTNLTPTLVASANSDVLVGLDINPTFTNGAFTGVTNTALRVNGNVITGGILPIGSGKDIGSGGTPFGTGVFQNNLYATTFQGYSGGFNFSVGGTNMGRFHTTTGNLTLQNGGTFTDAGYKLDVTGTARVSGAVTFGNDLNFSATDSAIAFASGAARFFTGGSERMRITSAGNVGIGTSTPNGPLSIQANTGNTAIRLIGTSNASSNNAGIYWYNSNDSTFNGYLGNFSTSFDIYNERSTPMIFSTAGTERMRITSAGNVGIGTTTFNAANTKLQVLDGRIDINMDQGAFRVFSSSASFVGGIGTGSWAGLTGTDTVVVAANNLLFFAIGAERGRFTTNGNLLLGTTSDNGERLYVSGSIRATGTITANSDLTLKKNLLRIENALEKVEQINGYTYEFKEDDSKRHAGVIAQEIQTVLPEIVNKGNDGILGVEYGNISALLIEAIKEQQSQIEELKTLLKA